MAKQQTKYNNVFCSLYALVFLLLCRKVERSLGSSCKAQNLLSSCQIWRSTSSPRYAFRWPWCNTEGKNVLCKTDFLQPITDSSCPPYLPGFSCVLVPAAPIARAAAAPAPVAKAVVRGSIERKRTVYVWHPKTYIAFVLHYSHPAIAYLLIVCRKNRGLT